VRADFDTYSTQYPNVVMTRSGDGVVELRLHTDGGPLVWGDGPHSTLGDCFADVGGDPDNKVVVITGTGDEFIARLDDSWVSDDGRGMTPELWNRIYTHGQRLLQNLLDIEVPVIAAVNGKATVHAELAVLADIVIATDDTVFADAPHFRFGTVPGDGVHAVWPLLLGANRGRYFLLTGQRIGAKEALDLGVVSEVVPRDQLLERAHELAGDLARQPTTVLRYTRAALTHTLKALLHDTVPYGLALEGLGAHASWPTRAQEGKH
jgi:enoyl-CoA hydratase/carnithine racemase